MSLALQWLSWVGCAGLHKAFSLHWGGADVSAGELHGAGA